MGKTILVVEDNADHQFILTAHLEAEGHQVILAENGLKAMKLLSHEKVDLIVLDLWLPTLDGQSFLKSLRSYPEWNTIPVIVTSGVEPSEMTLDLNTFGVKHYFMKPYEPQDLIKAIGS